MSVCPFRLRAALGLLLISCAPLREFRSYPTPPARVDIARLKPPLDPAKKTVLLLASNAGTEGMDLLAPYEILSRAGAFNVLIVAPEAGPVPLWKGLVALPHYTLDEVDALSIEPGALVIPNIEDEQNPRILDWLRRRYRPGVYILSICEGARVAAESGLYDGRRLTTHSTALKELRAKYPGPRWTQGVRVAEDGDLLSTVGVSAGVDGALLLVERLGDLALRTRVAEEIHYAGGRGSGAFTNRPLTRGDKARIARKLFAGEKPDIAVLLEAGVGELSLAAILDSYARTFPRSTHAVSRGDRFVLSRHGLLLGPSAGIAFLARADEVHVPPESPGEGAPGAIRYEGPGFILDATRARIAGRYGERLAVVVMRMLEYPPDE